MRIERAHRVGGFSHEVEPAFELEKSHKDWLQHASVLTVHTIYCNFNEFKSNSHHDLMMMCARRQR